MLALFEKILNHLKADLAANGGIAPDKWKPYLNFLKDFLIILELFENPQWKADSEIIIAAINLFESGG